MRDLRFVRALPALEVVSVHGQRLVLLAGIESFRDGELLLVGTGNNEKRDIGGLAQTPIFRLSPGRAERALGVSIQP